MSTYQMTALMAFNENQQLSFQALLIHCGVDDPKELQSHILGLCSSKLKILVREGTGKNLNADDVFSVNDDFKSKFKRIKVPIVTIKESSAGGSADGGGVHGADGGDGTGSGLGGGGSGGMGGGPGSVPSGVEEERKHITEAAIVRVMKTRKTFSHNDLVAEVTRQLSSRFAPQPPVSSPDSAMQSVSFFSPLEPPPPKGPLAIPPSHLLPPPPLSLLSILSPYPTIATIQHTTHNTQFIKKRIESLIERDYLQRDRDDARIYTYVA